MMSRCLHLTILILSIGCLASCSVWNRLWDGEPEPKEESKEKVEKKETPVSNTPVYNPLPGEGVYYPGTTGLPEQQVPEYVPRPGIREPGNITSQLPLNLDGTTSSTTPEKKEEEEESQEAPSTPKPAAEETIPAPL